MEAPGPPMVSETRGATQPRQHEPVATTSTTPLIRCSQCKKHKLPSDFPQRVTNLQPYQVCLTHKWYWTDAKKAANWAPSEVKDIQEVCDEAVQLARGATGVPENWLVEGRPDDRAAMVQRIAHSGGWAHKQVTVRALAQTDARPSPTFAYVLNPVSPSAPPDAYRLTLYHHENVGKYTLTLRPEGKAKKAAAWSRPERTKAGKAKAAAAVVDNADLARPDATAQTPDGVASMEPVLPTPPNDIEVVGRPAKADPLPPQRDKAARKRDRDREIMPPPPVPMARPPKKGRRIEPVLVSPAPSSSSSTTQQSPFSGTHDWSRFLSFPTHYLSNADTPIVPIANGSSSSHSSQHDLRHTSHGFHSSAAASSPASYQRPLTLWEMLGSSLFDPPNLDSPPAQPLHPVHNQRQSHLRLRSSAPAPTPPPPTAVISPELTAAISRALTEAGYSTGGTFETPAAPVEEEEEYVEEAEEAYYEDSIPDTSSEEEEDEEADAAEAAEASDVSSFFESSAEETDYASEGEAVGGADEEEEEEDDWLEGFAAQQMGLQRGGARVRARGQPRGRKVANVGDGDNELSEMEQVRVGKGGSPGTGGDDEIDELDSGDSGRDA
ncbi:hypothetical protein JCM10295v2_002075 [Rhodotorula toruloides]